MYAIKNNVERLKDDNNKAKKLAQLLDSNKNYDFVINEVETNIILIDTSNVQLKSADFVAECKNKGVLLYPWSEYTVRAITHLDITDKDIEAAITKIVNAYETCMKKKGK